MLDQIEAYEKNPSFNTNSKGHTHPCFLVIQTSEVPRNSPEVPRIAAGTQPLGKSSEVLGFWKFRPIKLPESGGLSRIKDS
jgi:hypothetical protein